MNNIKNQYRLTLECIDVGLEDLNAAGSQWLIERHPEHGEVHLHQHCLLGNRSWIALRINAYTHKVVSIRSRRDCSILLFSRIGWLRRSWPAPITGKTTPPTGRMVPIDFKTPPSSAREVLGSMTASVKIAMVPSSTSRTRVGRVLHPRERRHHSHSIYQSCQSELSLITYLSHIGIRNHVYETRSIDAVIGSSGYHLPVGSSTVLTYQQYVTPETRSRVYADLSVLPRRS